MSSPTDCYSHPRGLRIRPVHELDTCVVFAPAQARLFRLNPHAWLVLELCRGQPTAAALRTAYLEAVMPPLAEAEATASLAAAITLLLRHGLLNCGDTPTAASPAAIEGGVSGAG